MKLIYRMGFYMIGLSFGLIFLAVILKGKKTSCNYGPNDRVINDMSKKNWKQQNSVTTEFDSIAFNYFLKKARVDFRKSNINRDSCNTYFLSGNWLNKGISVQVENCEKSIEVLQLNYKTQ